MGSVIVLRDVHGEGEVPIGGLVLEVFGPQFCYFLPPRCEIFGHFLFADVDFLDQLLLRHEQLQLQAAVQGVQIRYLHSHLLYYFGAVHPHAGYSALSGFCGLCGFHRAAVS